LTIYSEQELRAYVNGELQGTIPIDDSLALVSEDGVAAPNVNIGGGPLELSSNSCGLELRFVRLDTGVIDTPAILDLHVPNGVWRCSNKVGGCL
jgi:hypothetical protein